MYVKEETAQLILDAIAWSNRDWEDSLGWDFRRDNAVATARVDFIRFCRDRGIEGVKKVVKIDAYRKDNA